MTVYAPKEIEETKCLDYDAHEGPLEEHEQDAANETHSPAELLFPREEVKCFLRANNERYSRQKEKLYGMLRVCKITQTSMKHVHFLMPANSHQKTS